MGTIVQLSVYIPFELALGAMEDAAAQQAQHSRRILISRSAPTRHPLQQALR